MSTPPTPEIAHFWPAVPAGGSGTRLWPRSRADRPKFLLPLGPDPDRSLLQTTVERLLPLCGTRGLLVVTGRPHVDAVAAQLPELPATNLIAEPSARNTAAPLALAAAVAVARDPDAVTGSFAADHVVADVPAFHAAVRTAAAVAAEDEVLVTIGLRPTRPDTGYGYLDLGPELPDGRGHRLAAFVEKPDAATATAFVAAGHLWNAGMFVWRADVFLSEVRRQLPELYAGVRRAADALLAGGPVASGVLAEVWPELPAVSVDVGVLEGAAAAGRVACVPADLGWTDVGTWDAVAGVRAPDADGTVNLGPGALTAVDSRRNVVATERPVVLLGVADLVVVDAGDVLLVCPRDRAPEVGGLVGVVRDDGRADLT